MIQAAPRIIAVLALAATTTVTGASVAVAAPAAPAVEPAAPAVTTAPAESTPTATTTSSIKGWARMYFPAPGNDVQITVDAHSEFTQESPSIPTRSWGTFRIYHGVDEPGKPHQENWGELEVDCLTTGGPTATVTGILVRTTPGGPWEDLVKRRVRMGVSFYVAGKGAGPSRIGLSGATLKGEPPLTRCMAPAPDAPVTKGGYTLKDKRPLD
ncbi:hypothetical protein [Streptosporangium sp. NPDC000396]|uniref:hypothetical protein n=1 Tax=Streptosporangium sp. NPDC000396 TaxID=3366185 RepID=UPI0036CE935D